MACRGRKTTTATDFTPTTHSLRVSNNTHSFPLSDGDPYACNVLLVRFSAMIHSKLRTQLRSPELVEDACQETFLRVLAYFHDGKVLHDPAALPGFVRSVSHNVAMEFLRAHTRQSQFPENAPEPADGAPNAESNMVSRERQALVTQVLSELPERDRELLRRVFLDEADKDLVCREFHVDRDYLRVLLLRARRRFRAIATAKQSAKGVRLGQI